MKAHKSRSVLPMVTRFRHLAAVSIAALCVVLAPLSMKAQQSNQPSRSDTAQLPDAPSAQGYVPKPPYTPVQDLTFRDRVGIYRQTLIRPYSLVGPAFGAGIGQAENEPPGWGQGAEGYGKRFAAGMARQTISETIRFGVAAADGEDPRYHLSGETGFWPRTKHVFVETFTSETAGGHRIPASQEPMGLPSFRTRGIRITAQQRATLFDAVQLPSLPVSDFTCLKNSCRANTSRSSASVEPWSPKNNRSNAG